MGSRYFSTLGALLSVGRKEKPGEFHGPETLGESQKVRLPGRITETKRFPF